MHTMNEPDKYKWIPVIMQEFQQMDDKGVMEFAKDQSGHGMKTKLVLTITYDNEMDLKYCHRGRCGSGEARPIS